MSIDCRCNVFVFSGVLTPWQRSAGGAIFELDTGRLLVVSFTGRVRLMQTSAQLIVCGSDSRGYRRHSVGAFVVHLPRGNWEDADQTVGETGVQSWIGPVTHEWLRQARGHNVHVCCQGPDVDS